MDKTRTQSASMEFTSVDKALGTRSGTISPLGGKERDVAEQIRNVASHRLRMRYSKEIFTAGETIKTDWVAVFGTRRFGILDYFRDGEFGRNCTLILEELN